MNLLPITEKENLRKGLRLRFIIVALFVLATGFGVGFIMLLPPYFLARNHFSGGYISGVQNTESEKILNLPNEIDFKLKTMQASIDGVSAVTSLAKIVSYLPREVVLNSVAFTKNQNFKEKIGTLISVSGTAANRDALISFSTLLKESGSFSLVEVPVSSLTKNKDLPFSMNIFIEN